jgi:uncharacterized protein
VIVDAHTHVFPPSFIAERNRLLAEEPVFADLYSSAKSKLATDDDLAWAMAEVEADAAVVAGFAWMDPGRCREHNDWLLTAGSASNGRLLPFCCVPPGDADTVTAEMERCAALGAAGFGELRLEHAGAGLRSQTELDAIAVAATRLGLPVLLHASEPVGHRYAGKEGGPLDALWRLRERHEPLTLILAHLGGGLPFYWHMPEVGAVFDEGRTFVDTAAVPWLYDLGVLRFVVDLIGADRVLFGSDFPLRHPRRDLAFLRNSGLTESELAAIAGGNAARLFRIGER